MLPLAHIYVSTRVANKKTPLLVFGSVLPDVSWTSKSEIARDQIHYAPREFYKFISENYPKLIDLAVGVKLHSNIDKGADFYCDDTETGFAKVEGRKIEKEVADLLGEEKSERSLGLAHSFIEASVDILLNKSKPEILELYKQSMAAVNLEEISGYFSSYLRLDKDIILKEFNNFLGFVGPTAYLSEESQMDRMVLLIKQRRGKEVDREETKKILESAMTLMADKYQNYLDNAISQIKINFSSILK